MDEQLYLMGLGLSLEEKVKRAIDTFRLYEPEALRRDPVGGFRIGNSGGKDSGVVMDLAKKSGCRYTSSYNVTTLDAPELIYHIKKYHPQTKFIRNQPRSLLQNMAEMEGQGPPTRISRWCCDLYKENSSLGFVSVFGIRASESPRRKINWKIWQPQKRDGWIMNPILYWSDENVWQYTRQNNLPYCSLYDEGFTRLGCIGCPMAGDARHIEFARWPRYESAWKRAFLKFWDKWHGVPLLRERWVSMVGKWPFRPTAGERLETRSGEPGFWTLRRWYDLREFQTWQELWRWWMEEMPKHDDENECQMGLF